MCPKRLKVEHMEKDYISNLPEHIIHEILGRCTMLDVARTSCVSKPLKSFSVSVPYLNINQQDFNHDQFKNIMENLSNLQILIFDNVKLTSESTMNWFFASFSLIKELRLVKCYVLEHLKVSGLCHLERLEIGSCEMLVSVEIQAPSLEKLVLTEIKREREDEFHLALSIDSQTCETLRELTLCNSSLRGITFTQMFSGCSNVESLVLDRCKHFYKISISSQKLRKLLLIRCFNLIMTDIKAPNLTSFCFSNCIPLDYLYCDDSDATFSTLPGQSQYSDEISHLQESTLDFVQMLCTENTWISLGIDKFKYTVGQKMVIYPENGWHDVIVLEDCSWMAELPLMTKISEVASRTIITTMSFIDLVDYVFEHISKKVVTVSVLAISSTDESKFYEVLEKKPKISCIQRSSVVVAKTQMDALLSTTYLHSYFHANGFFYQALLEAGMAATLKATWLLLKPKELKF